MPNHPLRPTDHEFGVQLGVLPFSRSYWVVPGRLLAGAYPGSELPAEATEKLRRLLDVGVAHVVDLTEGHEVNYQGLPLQKYDGEIQALAAARNAPLVYRRHPIVDRGLPTVAAMQAILDDLDAAARLGRASYVHCWGGLGRTGTVVGCWLARHGMAVGDRALAAIRWLRRTDPKADARSPENGAQEDFVRAWEVGK